MNKALKKLGWIKSIFEGRPSQGVNGFRIKFLSEIL
jgi:hypothetical protein